MNEDVIVVGGGFGGLTTAALLTKAGYHVTVLEASKEWGGCAGKFQHNGFTFPVGATLGMGFEKEGIHARILNHLGLSIHTTLLEHVMTINKPHQSAIHIYRDRQMYLQELKRAFPIHASSIESFYTEVWGIAQVVQSFMKSLPAVPLTHLADSKPLIQGASLRMFKVLPYLNKTLKHLLKKHRLHQATDFIHFIDGLLIDSMQTTSKHCSALIGSVALDIYHRGAYYVEGGLYKVAEALASYCNENGGEARLNRKVVTIEKHGSEWKVIDRRGDERICKHLVLNVPLSSLPSLLGDSYSNLSSKLKIKARIDTWAAFSVYGVLKEEHIDPSAPLFQQVIQSTHTLSEADHLFISLSKRNDRFRAPAGYRTFTASTHTEARNWQVEGAYDTLKEKLSKKMETGLQLAFPNYQDALHSSMLGAPFAWERFTSRAGGMVGGFPQTLDHSLFNSLSHRTPLTNLWLTGDHVFPGASTLGVSVSGYHVFRSITKHAIPID
ncbi:FAD-dependent oxidoreductase [Bacillus sp. FJAT-45037]|uniref:FAD-dependent oxidoreductase n=1 Tax=Bacillus sp. FJAT-45037 TaxID=2011007 RepID=UPI000C24CEF1